MVCISCIVIPLALWLWHRFLQPIVLKFWNPWGKVEDKTSDGSETKLTCPMSNGKSATVDPPKDEVHANGKGKVD